MLDNKSILIYVNNSLGELDWIGPFISSPEASRSHFYIYLKKVGRTHLDRVKVLQNYGLDLKNVTLLNNSEHITPLYKVLYKILGAVYKKTGRLSSFKRKLCTNQALKLGYIQSFDFIFRDYNLKDSYELENFINLNQDAKIVIYPHAVGIQKLTSGFEFKGRPRIVNADLWLENTNLSTRHIPYYGDIFYASGSPGLALGYEKKKLFSIKSKNVLIITRNNYSLYGSSRIEALKVFESALIFCQSKGLNVYIKHHPRDKKVEQYRKIQNTFNNVEEFQESLNNLSTNFRVCLSLFSTAGLFCTARGIPVLDITPYKDCESIDTPLPFHYCSSDKSFLTHDLIENNLQHRFESFEKLMSASYLEGLSVSQFNALKVNFPGHANLNIVRKLEALSK